MAIASPPDRVDHRLVIRRVTRRLIPFAFICYVVAYIDRVNIGFAATSLQRDLGLSDAAYGFGAGLFFLGYCLFEIPSNLLLERIGARRWIARIMIGWGLVSMATVLITGTWSFYAARVALGLAEAGFFPGMVLYLTYWIPEAERARTNALFMMAAPIAIAVGAPVSEAIMKLDGTLGLHDWQWLFLLEGLPAVVLGVIALRALTDRPEDASWLPPADRAWLVAAMRDERTRRGVGGHGSIAASLRSFTFWRLTTVYFLNTIVTYGLFLWLPKILKDASGAGGFAVSAMTAFPFVVALFAMVWIGRHSDRTGERRWHVAGCAAMAATGLILATTFQDDLLLLVLSFALSQSGQRSVMSVFWAIPQRLLGGTAAAAGIALINAVGNLGGWVGPSVMGWLRQSTGAYTGGLLVLSCALIAEGLLVLTLRLPAEAPAAIQRATAVRRRV
jgi:ACS family tartrate transporter-like MFS transporter